MSSDQEGEMSASARRLGRTGGGTGDREPWTGNRGPETVDRKPWTGDRDACHLPHRGVTGTR
ncbi:hypothetical protein JHW43_007156 [Diplocarpon mali]|nr:hypothetical protein JHW43_007156 [Diplocarpon mali]